MTLRVSAAQAEIRKVLDGPCRRLGHPRSSRCVPAFTPSHASVSQGLMFGLYFVAFMYGGWLIGNAGYSGGDLGC